MSFLAGIAAREKIADALRKEALHLHDLADDHFYCQNPVQGDFHRMLAQSYDRVAEEIFPVRKNIPLGRL